MTYFYIIRARFTVEQSETQWVKSAHPLQFHSLVVFTLVVYKMWWRCSKTVFRVLECLLPKLGTQILTGSLYPPPTRKHEPSMYLNSSSENTVTISLRTNILWEYTALKNWMLIENVPAILRDLLQYLEYGPAYHPAEITLIDLNRRKV